MPSYKVLDTRQISRMTPAGSTIETYRVWIQTGKGSQGSIDVDADQWNKDSLRTVLEEFADKLDLAHTIAS